MLNKARHFATVKTTNFNAAMKGKSFIKKGNRTIECPQLNNDLYNPSLLRETVSIDRPNAFYDEFYKQITAKKNPVDPKIWQKSRESQWLDSKINPELIVESTGQLDSSLTLLNSIENECLAIAQSGNTDKIKSLLQHCQLNAIKPTIVGMNYLLHAYIDNGELQEFKDLYVQLEKTYGVVPNIPTMTLLLKAYCVAGKPKLADALLEHLKGAGACLHQIVYHWMIEGHLASGNHARVLDLYWHAKQLAPPNSNLTALVINSCALNNEVERAFLVYKELLAAQIKPSNEVLSQLLGACVRRKEYFQEALGIVKQIESYGYPIRPIIYENLLLGCAKNKDLQSACVIWDCLCSSHVASSSAIMYMLWLLGSIENDQNRTSVKGTFVYDISNDDIVNRAKQLYQHFVIDRNIRPSSGVLAALLSVLARNSRIEDACAIFKEEHDKFKITRHPNSYESMFQMYDNVRDLKSALELRLEALKENVKLTFQSYCSLVNNAGLNEQVEVGLQLLREMTKDGKKPTVREVRMLCKAALDAEDDNALQEIKLLCKTIEVKGSAQKIFSDRGAFLSSLLDEVYGPERGKTKERSKRGMCKTELKKMQNVGLYKHLLQE